MKTNYLLGLPPLGLNSLSVGVAFFMVCLGVKTVIAPNLALKVANTHLVTSTSATKLENLAQQLKEQAEIIEQKDAKYEELEAVYQGFINNQVGNVELEEVFQEAVALPEADKLEQIHVEISETEAALETIVK